ncbi:hypothetical protein GCM10008995_00390 [Halobellus salinus]|uniref:DUF5305 domain-containing protein n=1 Tax=Halobellus salinus TaxID=931585 RepID=A0A830EBG5_9EURY|nr:DUF5305 domain-containing protein [Halobellus salinus]GGI94129.1 hypothetical protein GCM10008995_00390 [Halobellus salinus]SMP19531.1 hypothetical protein SAMN06265347_10741 [Halobellus salinus]
MSSSTQPSETRLRSRAVLHAQFTAIAIVCLLVAAAGAGLVYTTHVEPGTTTETRTTSPLTVETEYVHAAEVTQPNSVFATGAVLNDRSTYFTRIAPELDIDIETRYTAATASNVSVDVTSELVIRNVGEDGEVVYWSDREPLASRRFSGVSSGETVAVSVVLNTSSAGATAASIEEELGAAPGTTEVLVVSEVGVDGTFEGEPTTYTRTIEMTIEPGESTYAVSNPGLQSGGPERTERITRQRSYGPLRSIGGPLVFLVGMVGTGALVYARVRTQLALTPEEEAYLSYRDDRSEFAEWITRIRLPDPVFERPQAEASSLGDLVDFAIDNDTGVVEDPDTGVFYAVTGDLLYAYRPPSPTGSASEAEAEAATGTESTAEEDAGEVNNGDESEPSPDTETGVDSDRPDGADSATDAGSAE